MAYLSRCQIARKIPSLSRIVGSGNSPISKNNLLPITAKAYSSTFSFAKNLTRVSIPQFKKIAGPLTLSVNQIRASSTSGDHVRLWQLERIVSAAFIVLFPACIILNNAIVDVAFSILTVIHAHWGLEALIVDYARPAVVGTILPKVAFATLYLISVATLAGLMALIYNGPGVGGTIKKMWAIGKS